MSKLKKFLTICSSSVAAALVALPSSACFGLGFGGFGLGGLGFGLGCPFGLGFGGLGFSSFSSFAVSSFSSFGLGFSPFWW